MARGEFPSLGDPNRPAVAPGDAPWGDPASPSAWVTEAEIVAEPVRWREPLTVLAAVVLVDLVLWRGGGYSGWAVFFVVLTALLAVGSACRRPRRSIWLLATMTLLIAARLIWCGGAGAIAVGFVLAVATAGAMAGLPPYLSNVAVLAPQVIPAGVVCAIRYFEAIRGGQLRRRRVILGLAVVMPVAAVLLFSTIFILANPDFLHTTTSFFSQLFDTLGRWLRDWVPTGPEMLVWLATAWVVIGLLRPLLRRSIAAPEDDGPSRGGTGIASGTRLGIASGAATTPEANAARAPHYAAIRNTLAAVIVLFAVYLIFEYKRLWFGNYPEGFGYSSFAHKGAAWLTLALAVATALLSAMFRGAVLVDPRVGRLRRLAWLWSFENLLLAASVYNRLHIYIGFNGMTFMRVVGLLGISAVLGGFVAVVWMIARRRSFLWLVQRQLWVLAFAVFVGVALPVDYLVHGYNVARIMAGDSAPSVQISVHPIDADGLLTLLPLIDCPDETVRQGILARLAKAEDDAEIDALRRRKDGWTSYQVADRALLDALREHRSAWAGYADLPRRSQAWEAFKTYAYQWY